MEGQTLIVLPDHLIEKIQAILAQDVDLPGDLRGDLQDGLTSTRHHLPKRKAPQNATEDDASALPNTLVQVMDEETLLRLSKWAQEQGAERLKARGTSPEEYSHIALFAGTEVYLPPDRIDMLRNIENPDKPSPYLPRYLSPPEPLFAAYRSLGKQVSTILNVLFSIVGSGFAVYMAAITGAGYTRETGVLLGVLAGIIVGIADVFLLWVFVGRVQEGRKQSVKQWIGSSSAGLKDKEDDDPSLRIEGVTSSKGEGQVETVTTPAPKREIRLRRRAIRADD